MKNEWQVHILSQIQQAFDAKISKFVYNLLHEVFGTRTSAIVQLVSKYGISLIKEPAKILERWHEYFRNVFHNLSAVDTETIQNLPQHQIITSIIVCLSQYQMERVQHHGTISNINRCHTFSNTRRLSCFRYESVLFIPNIVRVYERTPGLADTPKRHPHTSDLEPIRL